MLLGSPPAIPVPPSSTAMTEQGPAQRPRFNVPLSICCGSGARQAGSGCMALSLAHGALWQAGRFLV